MALEIEKELKEIDKKIAWCYEQIFTLKKYKKSLENTHKLGKKISGKSEPYGQGETVPQSSPEEPNQ